MARSSACSAAAFGTFGGSGKVVETGGAEEKPGGGVKRKVGALVLLAAVGGFGGCVSDGGGGPGPGGGQPGAYMSAYRAKGGLEAEAHFGPQAVAMVPGLMGPNGEPVP